jgi:hypothetical protein
MDTTNERASIVEIYNNGAMIDVLEDSLLSATELTGVIVEQIKVINEYFTNPLQYEDDLDYKVIYFYNRANFITVMLSVARSYFASIQPQIKSLNSYATFDEAYFDLIIQRMNFMRESISIYRQNTDTQISKQWIAQVHTNLSNHYKETGRILESLDELEPVKLEIGMALGNYASKLYTLAFCTLDKSERKEMLIDALSYYKLVIEKADEGFNEESLYERALNHFRKSTVSIERLLEGEYAEIKCIRIFLIRSLPKNIIS